jgi:hypothetical protein
LNCTTTDWDSLPGSIMIVSLDPGDGAMDGRQDGSTSMLFSEKLEAVEKVSECHMSHLTKHEHTCGKMIIDRENTISDLLRARS